jgi:hypothetical protein
MKVKSAVSRIGTSFVAIVAIIVIVGSAIYVSTQTATSTISSNSSSATTGSNAGNNSSGSVITCGIVTGSYSTGTVQTVINGTTTEQNETEFLQSFVSCSTISNCNSTMAINGSEYCTLDVTNDITLGNPGYSVFNLSNSINFNGVTFTTICPSGYSGCPNTLDNSTNEIVFAGVIEMGLAFEDGTSETIASVLQNGGGENLTMLSCHVNPRAGIFIEYVPHQIFCRTYLLVQDGGSLADTGCPEASYS